MERTTVALHKPRQTFRYHGGLITSEPPTTHACSPFSSSRHLFFISPSLTLVPFGMTHRVCAFMCVLTVSAHSLSCMRSFFVSALSRLPCTKSIHSGRHFTLQLPSFLWLVTQNTIIHMQISSGGPPTIRKYTNATIPETIL